MRLFLVRHGDAHAGLRGPIAGPRGSRGLTDLGREQAERLRDRLADGRLDVDAVVTSELPRAIQTAEIVAPSLGISTMSRDCDLCEVHTGDADGLDWDDYHDRFGSFDMALEPDRAFAPGGDSWNSFHARVDRAMRRLAEEHLDRTVMAFCHAGVIIASMRILLGDGPDDRGRARLVPTNTSLTEWDFDGERWTLRVYNDANHL